MLASIFVVECVWPGVTQQEVEAANARVRAAGRPGRGSSLQFVGSLLVPGDQFVRFQLRAAPIEEVVRTSRNARLPFDRVAESLWLGAGERALGNGSDSHSQPPSGSSGARRAS